MKKRKIFTIMTEKYRGCTPSQVLERELEWEKGQIKRKKRTATKGWVRPTWAAYIDEPGVRFPGKEIKYAFFGPYYETQAYLKRRKRRKERGG